ncbi:biotin/lipoyl-binding protein [Paenibacillus sp. GSMTC-2017]|uniref:efflux RND transporter periplasmic adaptor subunit n=1 Tax=Paenibacillus sp. GSMTC-2017 TaxID=2794350 RepID=UPI0018D91CE0|nr:biotin/lipoyl-binding protein [Paenibacillus sp. GSMTC-2017]MBH5317402.1 biotin/lipoyl-binding protein [Paenibacillus sp. GSMTC-2017]
MLFRPKYKVILLLIMITSIALSGCTLLPVEEEPLKPPLIKPQQDNYRTIPVKKDTIAHQIVGNGTLESYHSEEIHFKAEGSKIQEIFVRSGNFVKKGDLLVQLNVGNLDIDLKVLELNMVKSGQAIKAAKLAENAEALEVLELQYEVDQMKYERTLEAFNSSQLRAGIDGLVTFVGDVKPGDPVKALETMVTIADPTKLRFSFQILSGDDDIFNKAVGDSGYNIGVGTDALVKVNGVTELQGKITQTPMTAPETDNEILKKRYANNIFVEVAELPEGITIGSRADVFISLQERKDVLVIPKSGLRNYLNRKFVRILEEENKIREVDVETGIEGATTVEITNGVVEGQLIVLQ